MVVIQAERENEKGPQQRYLLCMDADIQRKCLDSKKKDEKRDEKEGKRDDKSKPAKGNEEASSSKAPLGTLYTALSHKALVGTEEPLNIFYIESGASEHLIPSRGDLHTYRKFAKPAEISAVERVTLMVLGPCEWQRQPTV